MMRGIKGAGIYRSGRCPAALFLSARYASQVAWYSTVGGVSCPWPGGSVGPNRPLAVASGAFPLAPDIGIRASGFALIERVGAGRRDVHRSDE
jgi:hypothetical protein